MASRKISIPLKPFFLSVFYLLILLVPGAHSLAVQTPQPNSCFVYPSPASGDTAWAVYDMPDDGTALVLLYNEAGDLVSQVQEVKGPGIQQTGLDLFYFRKGIYLCRVILTLDTGEKIKLKIFKFLVTR
jgi:hypothetical protein